MRRRVHAGLNKGEARNSLARAVFFNRLGEMRNQARAAALPGRRGLNLVTAAIVLWNTVYLERATQGLVEAGKPVDGELLQFLSPLGWEHINLTSNTYGGRAAELKREVSALHGCPENLSVRFFPNSAGSPIGKNVQLFLVIGIFVVGRTSASGHNCWHVQKNRCGD
ncbi:Tn3 family transposase [Escherichia coli]